MNKLDVQTLKTIRLLLTAAREQAGNDGARSLIVAALDHVDWLLEQAKKGKSK